jgi:hypothetical protein
MMFLYLIKNRAVKMYGGIKVYLHVHAFLISALDVYVCGHFHIAAIYPR